MDKNELEKCIANDMSTYQIAAKHNISQLKVRYWLKKHNIQTKFQICRHKDIKENKICLKCNILKPNTDFYKKSENGRHTNSYCKECVKTGVTILKKNFKQECINYKGGKCIICEYNKCNSALEFHHINPEEKDFHISDTTAHKLNNKIKLELDKCILVCANCHREIHSGATGW